MKTLIIARADVLRNSLQTMLTGLMPGVEIDLLDDGLRTTGQMCQNSYDLVILYPGLPFETLLSAARAIKAVAPKLFTLIVIEEQDQMHLALDAGADEVILKGFSAASLIAALHGLQFERIPLNSHANTIR